MTNPADMSQEEFQEYERKREEKRRKILAELDAEIAKDEQELKVRIARTPNLDSAPDADKKEIEDIKRRISSNKEIRWALAEPDTEAYRHNDFLDYILDRPMVIGIAQVPVVGLGMMGLLEIRELYYKWNDEEKD